MKIQKSGGQNEDLKLSIGGNKLQGKAGREPTKPGYEPSARGTQKRAQPNSGKAPVKQTKAEMMLNASKVAPNQIIQGSELEQLRSE